MNSDATQLSEDLTKEVNQLRSTLKRRCVRTVVWLGAAVGFYLLVVKEPLISLITSASAYGWVADPSNVLLYWRLVGGGFATVALAAIAVTMVLKTIRTCLRVRRMSIVKMACDNIESLLRQRGLIH